MSNTSPSWRVAGPLADWLRQHRSLSLLEHATLAWQSRQFDRRLRAAQVALPLRPLKKPVFVFGLWGSDAHLVQHWLSECRGFSTPRAWQCGAPSTFVQECAEGGFGIEAQQPAEDEWALLAMGVPSPYRCFLATEAPAIYRAALQPQYWEHSAPELLRNWQWFLSAVSQIEQARLVIHSPGHLHRAPAIAGLWPDARWIWVLRDPLELWQACRTHWQSLASRKGVTFTPAQLNELVLWVVEGSVQSLAWVLEERQHNVLFLTRDEIALGPMAVRARLHAQGWRVPAWDSATHANLPRVDSKATGSLPGDPKALSAIRCLQLLHRQILAKPLSG